MITWLGKNIENLSRGELIEIITILAVENRLLSESGQKEREFLLGMVKIEK